MLGKNCYHKLILNYNFGMKILSVHNFIMVLKGRQFSQAQDVAKSSLPLSPLG